MRSSRRRTAIALATLLALPLAVGCFRKANAPQAGQTAAQPTTGVTTTTPVASATATATATGTVIPGDTPVPGARFKVGNWSVIVDRFRAQVAASQGVNIRSAPEATATNRTGSLAPGAPVDVEGRVADGQEAEPGNGTNWYYVGTAGTTPQFIYGPPGTLTTLTGSVTPAASTSTASPTASPRATP